MPTFKFTPELIHSSSCILFLLLLVSSTHAVSTRSQPRGRSSPRRLSSLSRRAPVSSGGWEPYGCTADKTSPRSLTGLSVSLPDSAATLEGCLARVMDAGMTYGGMQYGRECYGGNTLDTSIATKQPASDCNMPCSGNSAENCGAAYRTNAFSYVSPPSNPPSSIPSNWRSYGCVQDIASRTLNGYTYTDSGMTVAKCTSTCSSRGYEWAGVQYGSQCFCGNSFNGAGSLLPLSSCSMPCGGDSSTFCGNAWMSNVYHKNAGSSSPSPTTSTSTTSSTSTSSTPPAATSTSSTWISLGCTSDAPSRALTGYSTSLSNLTPSICQNLCLQKGFTYAGVQYASECYCGNGLMNGQGGSIASSKCDMACYGDSKQNCGGSYAQQLYKLNTPSAVATLTSASTSTSTSPSTSTSSSVSVVSPRPTLSPPSTGLKAVYAHHIVGLTMPYKIDDWLADIRQASSAGFDGFALNIGNDPWQSGQIASAYAAAQQVGNFKLFFSFDMTSLPCNSPDAANALLSYVTTYSSHPNQAYFNGKILVTTFAGADCTFGVSSSWDAAWQTAFKTPLANAGKPVSFIPSLFNSPSSLTQIGVIDGVLAWDSAWPMGGTDMDFSTDSSYISAIGSKAYIATVSPAFFTHYAPWSWNKNWIYRSDNFLFAYRWEMLIANRNRFDLVEALTWNDYGESSYLGTVRGAQPNSQAWVDGYDHTALLAINQYYATAFRTGSYPAITSDRVYLSARTHPKFATASNDNVGRPNYAERTDDNFYALIFATSPCTVTLSTPPLASSQIVSVPAGVTRLSYPLSAGSSMSVKMTRNGADVVNFTPGGYQFVQNPITYNFNPQFYASS